MEFVTKFACVFLFILQTNYGMVSTEGCINQVVQLVCPTTEWTRFADSCYFFGDVNMLYQQARDFCNSFDSNLYNSTMVQVDNIQELGYLKSQMQSRWSSSIPSNVLGFWNDVYQQTTNGNEIWRTSGDSINPAVMDWRNNEPYLSSHRCTVFEEQFNWEWNDVGCDDGINPPPETEHTAYALCEAPAFSITVSNQAQ